VKVVWVANAHYCDKNSDYKGGDNDDNNDDAQDDNRRNYDAHNDDVDGEVRVDEVDLADGAAPGQSQKSPLTGKVK
jgi:hypothetical protein